MTSQETEDQAYEFLKQAKPKASTKGKGFEVLYVPFGLIASFLSVILFTTVGGADLNKDKVYFGVGYGMGAILLTIAYTNVARWCHLQKSMNGKPIFFSLFYNNAFYVFMLLLCSSIIFSGLKPEHNLILSQAIAAGLPAWLSTLQV